MKPTNPIYLGDYLLEPPEDDDFEDGLTDPERAQLEFDNAEPNEYPE